MSLFSSNLFFDCPLIKCNKSFESQIFQPEVDIYQSSSSEEVAHTNARETILFGVTKIEEALYNICFDLKNAK